MGKKAIVIGEKSFTCDFSDTFPIDEVQRTIDEIIEKHQLTVNRHTKQEYLIIILHLALELVQVKPIENYEDIKQQITYLIRHVESLL